MSALKYHITFLTGGYPVKLKQMKKRGFSSNNISIDGRPYSQPMLNVRKLQYTHIRKYIHIGKALLFTVRMYTSHAYIPISEDFSGSVKFNGSTIEYKKIRPLILFPHHTHT